MHVRHTTVRTVVALVISVVIGITGAVTAAAAGPAPAPTSSTGTIKLVLHSPVSAPTAVTLTGPATFAHSTDTGGRSEKSFRAPTGTYVLTAPDVVVTGQTFRATVTARTVKVARGRTTQVQVSYVPAPMGRDLRLTDLTGTTTTLAWTPPPTFLLGTTKVTYAVRRTSADATPLTAPTQGVAVAVTGTTANDRGLRAGERYRYSLFSRSQYGWNGPVELEVGTTPPAGSTNAAYALAANSELLAAPQIVSAVPTGDGVRLQVTDVRQVPAVGTAVVLPISADLAGGFLGVVDAVGSDGTVHLVAGGIPDAFDFYELPPTDFSGGSVSGSAPLSGAGLRAARSGVLGCDGSAPDSASVEFAPTVSGSGTFEARWDKTAGVTRGAHVAMAFDVVARGAATVTTEAGFECSLHLPDLDAQITVFPVPIALKLGPVASLSVAGAAEVSDLGVEARAATRMSADFTLPNRAVVDGGLDLSLTTLEPVVTTTATLTTEIGGGLLVGPGAGTEAAGVILGISGSLTALKSQFKAAFEASDPRAQVCYTAKHQYAASVSVTARAWAPLVDVSKELDIPGLSASQEYPNSPQSLPAGCAGLPAPLRITTNSVTDPAAGSPYRYALSSTSEGPVTWSTVAGSLPPGLALAPTGVISGTPTQTGDFPVTVKVVVGGAEAFMALTLHVSPPLPPPVSTDAEDVAELAGFVKTYFVCGGGCTSSWGDPHLTTVEGVHHDYQGVGEFVAARSGSGLEVQVRQQPWGSSRSVSVNNAVAARVGGSRVVMHRTEDGAAVTIDGRAVQLGTAPRSLGGTGSVGLDEAGRVVVTWADGSALAVGSGVPQALDIQFAPSAAAAADLVGLLAAGAESAAPIRVTQGTSLFDYAAGQSTATFTDTAFPYGEVTVASLPEAQKTAATTVCTGLGVSDRALLDACVLDVAVTGEPRFAVSAAETQAAAEPSDVVARSAVGDAWTDARGASGKAVLTYGHVGCDAVDVAGSCTGGVWGNPVPGAPFVWRAQQSHAPEDVTFSKSFTVDAARAGLTATMTLWADQGATATLNGTVLPTVEYPRVLTSPVVLRPGENTVTIRVPNPAGGDPRSNPAGLAWKIAVEGGGPSFDVTDFGSTDDVSPAGSATVVDRALRLTDDVGQNGYGWATATVSPARSFSSTVDIALTAGAGTPADGVVLLLHSDPRGAIALNTPGDQIGYMDFRPSVAVELDTFHNGDRDPDANHVAIVVDGESAHPAAVASPDFPLVGGVLHLRVQYDAGSHLLQVFLSDDGTAAGAPLVSATVDLASHLGARAHLGLVGSTGAAYEVAAVRRWSFTSGA